MTGVVVVHKPTSALTITAITEPSQSVQVTSRYGDPRVGDLSELTTEDKTSLTAAINEINMSGVEFTILYDNAKAG